MKKTNETSNNICEINPPAYLKEAVFARINLARRQQAKRKKFLFLCGFFACGAGFLAGAAAFAHEMINSDFGSIFSISFTDTGTLVSYWQEYTLSLLETFPAEAFAYLLAPIFIILVLAKQYSLRTTNKYEYTNV